MILSSLLVQGLIGCTTQVCGTGTVNNGGSCVPATVEEDTAVASGVPNILVFASDVDAITYNESVNFSAIVTHPDGVDQIIGGLLQSATGATYGAFATGGDEGAYGMSVSWWEINAINALDIDADDTVSRPFVAIFYDETGNTSTSEKLTITAGCEDSLPACDGVCGTAC